jgi:hypothetical protein
MLRGCWVPHQGSSIATRADSVAGHSSADDGAQHGAFRPRLLGLKQIADLAVGCGGHADFERASSRVRVCSRGLGQATDLAIAQAVVDEREHFASDRDGRLVLAAPLGDPVEVSREFAAPVIADGALDDRPAHQP